MLGDYKLAVEDCVEELSRIQLAADEVALPYLNKHLGYAYLKMGETEKAIVALSAAIEIKRDFRQAYDLLEEAYTKLVKRKIILLFSNVLFFDRGIWKRQRR